MLAKGIAPPQTRGASYSQSQPNLPTPDPEDEDASATMTVSGSAIARSANRARTRIRIGTSHQRLRDLCGRWATYLPNGRFIPAGSLAPYIT
jgi:hypothetical protein